MACTLQVMLHNLDMHNVTNLWNVGGMKRMRKQWMPGSFSLPQRTWVQAKVDHNTWYKATIDYESGDIDVIRYTIHLLSLVPRPHHKKSRQAWYSKPCAGHNII